MNGPCLVTNSSPVVTADRSAPQMVPADDDCSSDAAPTDDVIVLDDEDRKADDVTVIDDDAKVVRESNGFTFGKMPTIAFNKMKSIAKMAVSSLESEKKPESDKKPAIVSKGNLFENLTDLAVKNGMSEKADTADDDDDVIHVPDGVNEGEHEKMEDKSPTPTSEAKTATEDIVMMMDEEESDSKPRDRERNASSLKSEGNDEDNSEVVAEADTSESDIKLCMESDDTPDSVAERTISPVVNGSTSDEVKSKDEASASEESNQENILLAGPSSPRPLSAASVHSDLLDSPAASPRPASAEPKDDAVIVVETPASASRKRPMSHTSSCSEEEESATKKSRVVASGSVKSDEKSRDGSEIDELITVLSDDLLHGLVRQKLNSLLTKELDQVVAPLRKRISELQNLNELWKEKFVNLQKQINDMDMVHQRAQHKRASVDKPATRNVAVQACTVSAQTRAQQLNKQAQANSPSILRPAVPTPQPALNVFRPPTSAGTVDTSMGIRLAQVPATRPTVQHTAVLNKVPQSLPTIVLSSPPQSSHTSTMAVPQTLTAASLGRPRLDGQVLKTYTVREMLSSTRRLPNVQTVSDARTTLQLPRAGNQVVIDLTSEEEKRNQQLAGLVQSVVMPNTIQSNAVGTLPNQQQILLNGNNVPVLLQALNTSQTNQGLLLSAQPNSRNVISIVQTSTGLVQKTGIVPKTVTVTTGPAPVKLVPSVAPNRAAVPVSLVRAPAPSVVASAAGLRTPSTPTVTVNAAFSAAKTVVTTHPVRVAVSESAPLTSTHPAQHPALLPPRPVTLRNPANGMAEPPRPTLKISRVAQGIVLSWNMVLQSTHEEITNYQLYAYQESSAPPSTSLWKRVGDVKALPLPMACTLTQFQEGNKYHFAVRAVDKSNRVGPFSEPASIHLVSSKV